MRPLAGILCGALLPLLALPARADSVGIVAYENWSSGNYVGTGLITAVPGSRLGDGWAWRFWGERSSYEYDGEPGRVRGTALGTEVALGRMKSAPGWSAGGWLGLSFRDTSLAPFDPTSTTHGSRTSLKLQLDTTLDRGPLRTEGIASYQFAFEGYWLRLRSGLPAGKSRLGAELVWQGDPTYSVRQQGLYWSYPLRSSLQAGIKAGRRDGAEEEAYVGIEWGWSF